VIEAMEQAFMKTTGSLADRLIASLVAADAAGGQTTGRESAALLIRTPDGFPMDIDLRVDDSADPVSDLRRLYDLQSARQQVISAEIAARRNQPEQARELMISAVARAHEWPRVLLRAAKLAEQLEERDLALKYLTSVFSRSPVWATEAIGSGDYAELGANPAFHAWVSPEQERQAVLTYRDLLSRKEATAEDTLRIARILLEAGHAAEAQSVLATTTTTMIPLRMARAEADTALGNYTAALNECRQAQSLAPNDWRIRRRISRLQERVDSSQDLK
jgi:tetratricopeptide (TPR) repeat protein